MHLMKKKRRLNYFLFTSTSTKYCPPSTSTRLCQRFQMTIYNTIRGRLCCDRMVVMVDLPMQSVPITTQVVSSNPAHGIFWSRVTGSESKMFFGGLITQYTDTILIDNKSFDIFPSQ
jgi:hypothetical protein